MFVVEYSTTEFYIDIFMIIFIMEDKKMNKQNYQEKIARMRAYENNGCMPYEKDLARGFRRELEIKVDRIKELEREKYEEAKWNLA
jgi:hypothetical protein